MFKVSELTGFGGGEVDEHIVTFLDESAGDGVGSTAESVTLNLGTAHKGDKLVVLFSQGNWTGNNVDTSTLKFDGTTSLIDSGVTSSDTTGFFNVWYYDDVAGIIGGSTSIDATFSEPQLPLSVAAYRIAGSASGGPVTSDTDNTTDPSTLSLNVSADGIIIAGAYNRNNGTSTAVWSGVTEDFDRPQAGADGNSGASDKFPSAQTPQAITADWSSAGLRSRAIAVSFDKA